MERKPKRVEILSNLEIEQVLTHPVYVRSQTVAWLGVKGVGKTEGLRHYIKVREPRVFALDSFGDFPFIREAESLRSAFADMQRYPLACRRRVQPSFYADTHAYGQRAFIGGIESLRNCLWLMDELSLWVEPKVSRSFRKLVVQGRQIGIRVHFAAQQVSLIPYELQSQMTHIVVFHVQRPADLDALERWVGKRIRDIATKLDPYTCCVIKL